MKKRCTLGKSCGATCISNLDDCLLGIGAAISSGLGKVRELVKSAVKKSGPGLKKASYFLGLRKRPTLDKIYAEKGFNAKPEVVKSVADLEKRKDILRHPDGKAHILYRGVSSTEFSRQFKGQGNKGGIHFPGSGIYGNGTYASSEPLSGKGDDRSTPIARALEYARNRERRLASRNIDPKEMPELIPRVTAFAIKSGANLGDYKGPNIHDNRKGFHEWAKGIIRRARNKTGIWFNDVGEAAATLGIDAYRVPLSKYEDYWVILNRGAIIVSEDPGI